MRKAVATIPGAQVSFGQPISHRIDHMISGSKTNLAVKIFGPDLGGAAGAGGAGADACSPPCPASSTSPTPEQASVPQLVIDFDRRALPLHGLTPASLSRSVEALFQGTEAGEIVEGGVVSRVVVRLPERLRASREELEALPVPTPSGRTVRLGDVARPRFDLGPGLVRRENVERVAMVTANITGADLAGTVEQVQQDPGRPGSSCRPGTGSPTAGSSRRRRAACATSPPSPVLVLLGMYGLLFFAFRNHRHALIVLVNLPLALVGGVFAVALGGGVLSVASLVGFITLFGIATRNGVLLVSHYQHLMKEEGLPLARGGRPGLATSGWRRC